MNKKNDVIVVGTGMGGATVGYALAKAGLKVLFIEKGLSRLGENNPMTGQFAETFGFSSKQPPRPQLLKQSGRYFGMITDVSTSAAKSFTPFIGAGTGGSTAVYGAILERFRPEDFVPGRFYASGNAAESIPEKWPVSLEEMTPFYQQAEQLYGVRNTLDNESVPDTCPESDISVANQLIWEQLKANGNHPYLLPTATDNIGGCKDNCQSFLCRGHCKNDSEKCALRPALENYQAELLDDCEVLELISHQNRVTEIRCRQGDKILHLSADIIILAAGALNTPALLQKSSNLANSSGLVGRYLMRHYVDLFAVQVKGIEVFSQSQKQIGFNDLYTIGEEKFGTVQSFGALPPLEVVIEELRETLPSGLGGPVGWGMKTLFPLINHFYRSHFQDQLIFASIVEDIPNKHNRINVNHGQIELSYTVAREERKRIDKIRQEVVNAFRPLKVSIMKQADNNLRLAHACGTCRFGDDPSSSVLNRFNQTHDVSNLYITDASFFPTSGGINPSLTIAANALRVADSIVKD